MAFVRRQVSSVEESLRVWREDEGFFVGNYLLWRTSIIQMEETANGLDLLLVDGSTVSFDRTTHTDSIMNHIEEMLPVFVAP